VLRSSVMANLLSTLLSTKDKDGNIRLPGSSDDHPVLVNGSAYDFTVLLDSLYGKPG
jgi:hypothetical protein